MTRPTNNKFILPIITFIIFLGIWEMVIIIGHYQPVLLPGPALVG
ncbi:ABC transporter permease, partial [Staphylococcus aureus]|nr:ABC transporter permease [Staphylococcus aureus]